MLLELVRAAAARHPDQPVVATATGSLTYAKCLTRSEQLAGALRARSIARFACVVADVRSLLPLLCASSAVGSEACMYPVGLADDGLEALLSTFNHDVIVSDRDLNVTGAAVVPFDALTPDDRELPSVPERAPTMILTTGTTGPQRGALHDWGRLVSAARHTDPLPGARWLLTYNLNQFAGVQMLLHVLSSRATLVVAASNQPRDGVAAACSMGVTHISATPTFWRLFLAILDDGTTARLRPQLGQLTLGGEAVPGPLVEELRRRFPEARISQVYAATEFGSGASVHDGRSGLPLSLLDRGDEADVRLRIIDGELHVRSRYGMLGYYGDERVGEGWRPTGDLVEVDGDRIRFVGRSSEIINVGGVKVHPLPVEERVGTVAGVQLVRAYGRPNPITGNILVVDVVPQERADLRALEHEIRSACATLGPAARPRRIRFVGALDLEGQKISRREWAV